MRQNTPELWDEVWSEDVGAERDLYALALERASVRWQRIAERAERRPGGISGARVVEIGAGAGTASALFAEAGASVTVLDYSRRALERARAFYANNGLAADFVMADALDLPGAVRGTFDISVSFGLAEHFRGEARRAIIGAHFDVLAPGGETFVSVPNRFCVPYRLYKTAAELTGHWKVGEEYPFSRSELLRLAREAGGTDAEVFGESALGSVHFLDLGRIARRLSGRPDRLDLSRVRPQRATPLDATLAYALILHARRAD